MNRLGKEARLLRCASSPRRVRFLCWESRGGGDGTQQMLLAGLEFKLDDGWKDLLAHPWGQRASEPKPTGVAQTI